MKVRATGSQEDIDVLVNLLGGVFKIIEVSKPFDDRDDFRNKRVYIDLMSKDREVASTLQDYQVIEFCSKWRTKADVMHQFRIPFEAAEEILERLINSGALVKYVEDKHYAYTDSRWLQFVEKRCGTCDNRSLAWGECYAGVKPDDIADTNYIPVGHPACSKYLPSQYAIHDVMTKENYDLLSRGEL